MVCYMFDLMHRVTLYLITSDPVYLRYANGTIYRRTVHAEASRCLLSAL